MFPFADHASSLRRQLHAAAIALSIGGALHATDFRDVPRVTVQDPARFRAVFESARSGLVRVAVLGDSQETAPNGWGGHYIAHLCAGFARIYGPATESVLVGNTTHATPPQWLATVRESSATSPSVLPPSAQLPGTFPASVRRSDASWSSAWRCAFLHDASHMIDPELVAGPWFEARGPFRAEVLLAARPGAGALEWANAPTDLLLPDDGAAIVASGSMAAPAKAPSGSLHWRATPVLDFAGKRHLQLLLRGSSTTDGAEFVGMRWRSDAPPRGVVVQGFSKGGIRLGELVGQHGGSGAMLAAIAPHIAVLQYGANDAGNPITPADWRTRLEQAIAWIRVATQDPAFPVILAAELRVGFSPGPWTVFDWMPVVAHEIALADANVLALNLHRSTHEEYLWGPDGSASWMPYLADSAHLRPHAQVLLARAFVGDLAQALSISDPSCGSPSWADCVRVVGAGCETASCRRLIEADAAVLGLPFVAGADCTDADADGTADVCLPPGDPDLDGDGFVDATDLAELLAGWGLADRHRDLDRSGTVGAGDLSILLAAWR